MVHLDAREAKEMTAALVRMRLSMQANVTSAIDATEVLEKDGDNLDDAIGTHKDEVKGALKRTSRHLTKLQLVMNREKIYLKSSFYFFHLVLLYIFCKRFRIYYLVSALKSFTPTSSVINATLINATITSSVTSIINESIAEGSTYEVGMNIGFNLDENMNHITSKNEDITEVAKETNLSDPIVRAQVLSYQFDKSQLLSTNSIDEDVTENTIADGSNRGNLVSTELDATTQHTTVDYDIATHKNIEYETETDGIVKESPPAYENNDLVMHDTIQDMQ